MIAGRVGEFVDDRLVDGEPIADADFLADILGEVARALEFQHHLPLSGVAAASSTRSDLGSGRRHDRSRGSGPQRMRYTKTALLTFGAGVVLALVVVATETQGLARVASAAMALGIAAIPVGMAIDWRLATRIAQRSSRRRGKPRTRRAAAVARRRARPRKPSRPGRR